MTIRLIKTDSEFIETAGHMIPDVDGGDWYHLPCWYKKVGDGLYEEYSFDKLPNELKERIKMIREQIN